MTVTTKLTQKEFSDASKQIALRTPMFKIMYIVISIVFIFNLVSALAAGRSILPVILPMLLIFAVFFAVFYFSMGKAFKANKALQETIVYEFTDDVLITKGASFQTQLAWKNLHKVSIAKSWLLLYQTRQIANVIPIADVSPEALRYLKQVLTTHKVSNNL